jgi:hypothetical protein
MDDIEKEEVAPVDATKRQLREQIAADVQAFLKAGGEYTDCPNLNLAKYNKRNYTGKVR